MNNLEVCLLFKQEKNFEYLKSAHSGMFVPW